MAYGARTRNLRSHNPKVTGTSESPVGHPNSPERRVTEIAKVAGRGHALTIDGGWRDAADLSLAFIRRFVQGPDRRSDGETVAHPLALPPSRSSRGPLRAATIG